MTAEAIGKAAWDATMPDVIVENHGTVWAFEAKNENAERCFADAPDWAHFGGKVVIDWRPARTLVHMMEAEGFKVEVDDHTRWICEKG